MSIVAFGKHLLKTGPSEPPQFDFCVPLNQFRSLLMKLVYLLGLGGEADPRIGLLHVEDNKLALEEDVAKDGKANAGV